MTGGWIFRRAPWLLVALVLALLLPGTATLPIVDRDEPRFATATREMIERSDWIVPTFNGHYRFDKPVLTYWLMRAGYGIFGIGEFGARVHAIAAALVLVLATWWAGRRWFGERVGLLAGVMLASCLQVFIHGRLSLADMPMVACVVIACVALVELLGIGQSGPADLAGPAASRPWRSRWWWALYGSLGVGFLAKGPIVAAVPMLALLLHRFVFRRKPLPWQRLGVLSGLGLALVIIAAWGIPALLATHGLFWRVGMGEHVVQRGFEKFNGRGYTPFFYLATAPLSLFPWIACIGFLPWIVRRTWSDRTAWLLAWLVAPYVIFTAYATQLPHYVLPAFPALFLLLGRAFASDRAERPRWAGRLAWALLGLFALVFGAAAIAVQLAQLPAEALPLRSAFTGVCLVMLGFIGLAVAVLRGALGEDSSTPAATGPRAGGLALAVAGIAVLIPGAMLMAGGVRQTGLSVQLAGRFSHEPPQTRYVGAGFSEPSLVFYTGKQWTFPQSAEELAAVVSQPGPLVVITIDEECDPLKLFAAGLTSTPANPAKPLFRPGPKEWAAAAEGFRGAAEWTSSPLVGFNLGRTRWQHLRVWVRKS